MSNTILPPRFEDRAFSGPPVLPVLPVYEDSHAGSLRPTWLPLDPSSYPPPTLRSPQSRGSRLVQAAQIGALLVATFGLAFGSVVGSHVAREHFAKRAAASALISVPAQLVAVTAASDRARPDGVSPAVDVAASGKTADSGVTLTVDVNSLPVSKGFAVRGGKAKGSGRRSPSQSAGS